MDKGSPLGGRKLGEVRFGLSYLQNGTPVLTPFGNFGGIYEFRPRVYTLYRCVMAVFIAIGVVAAALIAYRYASGSISRTAMYEAAMAGLVLWDTFRVLCICLLFVAVPPARFTRTDRTPDLVRWYNAINIPIGLAAMSFVEAVMTAGLLFDIADGQEEFAHLVPWILLWHVGLYLAQRLRSADAR